MTKSFFIFFKSFDIQVKKQFIKQTIHPLNTLNPLKRVDFRSLAV